MDWQTRLTALLRERFFSIGDTDTTAGSALATVTILVVAYLVARNGHRDFAARRDHGSRRDAKGDRFNLRRLRWCVR